MGQKQLVITADAAVANYVFNGQNKENFVRRPGAEEGINELGMLHHGLIWNNDLPVWRKIRGCFQKNLGEAALSRAVEVVKDECQDLLRHGSHPDGKAMSLLKLARKINVSCYSQRLLRAQVERLRIRWNKRGYIHQRHCFLFQSLGVLSFSAKPQWGSCISRVAPSIHCEPASARAIAARSHCRPPWS